MMDSDGNYIRLLDIEPKLGAGLTRRERAAARRLAVAPVATLPPGHWSEPELRQTLGKCGLGCLIADGLIARDLSLDGRTATHLLGRGDILAPATDAGVRLPLVRIFSVADATRLALLDECLPLIGRGWPSIVSALVVQLQRQGERLAVQQLISQLPRADQRIVALLWHLADRWGKQEREGVVVPLSVGHEAIGHLIGGRRSTVSAALGTLADRELVTRLVNGTWLLNPASLALLDDTPPPEPVAAPRLVGGRTRGEHPGTPLTAFGS
jgi:hypothetical protein